MSITKDFSNNSWYKTVTGSGVGSVTVGNSGATVSISSPTGGSARCRYFTNVLPGEKVTFSIQARNVPAGLSGYAAMFIDSPLGSLRNVQLITSDDLQVYTISAIIPYHLVGPQKIAFGIGSYTSLDGSAEFLNPVITRSGSNVVMEGMIQFNSGGGWSVREDYLNYNIGTITWNDADKTVLIKPAIDYQFAETGSTNEFRPILFITGSPDQNTNEVYSWSGSNTSYRGWCKIQACTHAAAPAVPVNLSNATNGNRFCSLRLVMVGNG